MRCWLFRHSHRQHDTLLTALAYGRSYRCKRCNKLIRYAWGHRRYRYVRRDSGDGSPRDAAARHPRRMTDLDILLEKFWRNLP